MGGRSMPSSAQGRAVSGGESLGIGPAGGNVTVEDPRGTLRGGRVPIRVAL